MARTSKARGEAVAEVAQAQPEQAKETPNDGNEPIMVVSQDVRPDRAALEEAYAAHQAEQDEPEDLMNLGSAFEAEEEPAKETPAVEKPAEGKPREPEQPAEAASAPEGYYVGTFRTKEDAERGFKETKAWATRVAQENAAMRQRLQQAAAMQAAPQVASVPQQGDYRQAPDDLSAAELERLQYEDYPKYLDYQRQRESRLLEQAEQRAEQRVMQHLQGAQYRQLEQKLEMDMRERVKTNYGALKDDLPLVEAEVIRMSQELRSKLSSGVPLDPDEAQRWYKVYENPITAVDWAAERLLARDNRIRQTAETEAKQTKTRLPDNPAMATGGPTDTAAPIPQSNKPQTASEYERERLREQNKRFSPSLTI
jgi:hypothetical protein